MIDQPGRFRINFCHGRPKQINGLFDDKSMGLFERYLATYRPERAGA